MDNERIIKHLKEICSTSEPEEKKAFFQGLEDQGLTSRRPVVIICWQMDMAAVGGFIVVHHWNLLR